MPQNQIPFLDLKALHNRFAAQDAATLAALHGSGQYVGGDFVTQFEVDFANFCGVSHCVGAGNGLDALTISLLADLELGNLPEKARILIPAHTYIATYLSIIHAGMQPVPVDVDELLLTNSAIEPLIGNIDGIVCVDIYGKMVDGDVYAFAKANSLPIYCDAAQSHGATNNHGARSGSLARASAFSFYPTKNLGALGDAGAITTNNAELAAMCRKIANYGRSSRFINDIIGVNSRLDPLQAGFLSTRLQTLDTDNAARISLAKSYLGGINNPKIGVLSPSYVQENAMHVFPVFVQDRTGFTSYLKSCGIESSCHYELPPHKQQALKGLNHLSFPVTERLHATEVSLPCHPLLNEDAVRRVVTIINEY